MKIYIFWDITPFSLFKSTDVSENYVASIFMIKEYRKQETSVKQVASRSVCCLILPVSCLAYPSTLKMEICSSKTPVDFQRATWRYIPDNRIHHIVMCRGCCVTYRRVSDWLIWFIDTLFTKLETTGNYRAIADLRTLQFTVAHALWFSVFTSHMEATDL
jgi:hypothetical protein